MKTNFVLSLENLHKLHSRVTGRRVSLLSHATLMKTKMMTVPLLNKKNKIWKVACVKSSMKLLNLNFYAS